MSFLLVSWTCEDGATTFMLMLLFTTVFVVFVLLIFPTLTTGDAADEASPCFFTKCMMTFVASGVT